MKHKVLLLTLAILVCGWLARDFPELERRIRDNVPCE
jgi:hypothetical protein